MLFARREQIVHVIEYGASIAHYDRCFNLAAVEQRCSIQRAPQYT